MSCSIDDARIGEAGGGAGLVFGVVAPTFLVGLAAVNVGIAQAALSAAARAREVSALPGRQRAGGGPGRSARCSRTWTSTSAAARAARCRRRRGSATAAMRGRWSRSWRRRSLCTDAAARVTQGAFEVCGGQGYTPALPIERHLRDARAGAVMAPTNGVLRTLDRQGDRRASGPMSGRGAEIGRGGLPPADRHDLGAVPHVLRRCRACRPTTSCSRTTSGSSTRCSTGRSTSAGTRTPPTWRSIIGSAADARSSGCATSTATGRRCSSTRQGTAAGQRRRARGEASWRWGAATRATRRSCRFTTSPRRVSTRELPRCVRFDTDLGKHGDTGDSELHVVRAVAEGEADAGALVGRVLRRVSRRVGAGGGRPRGRVAQPDLLPLQLHGPGLAGPRRSRSGGREALLAMDYDDPSLRPAMDLEGVRRWIPGDASGYASLQTAMREQALLS